jgi:uncharacterized membrane protein YhhN
MIMSRKSTILVGLAAAAALLLSLAGFYTLQPWLQISFKPLATILILSIALSNWLARKDSYSLWITIGLAFSLAGDVALIWPHLYFLPGLSAFLLAHLAYLVAFTRAAKLFARPILWLPYFAIAATLFLLLLPQLPAVLKIPVAHYSFFLASMAAQAMGRFLTLRTSCAGLAAIGALFFMLSDTLLSFDRFRSPFHLAPLFVLVSYYIAQWLIASSTADSWLVKEQNFAN